MEQAKSKYEYTPEMGEISGFGGGYEKACRNMVIAGLEWCDQQPSVDLSYKEFQGVYGLTTGESDDMKTMQQVMFEASGKDCTGAMMQACMGHIMAIRKNSWDWYVAEMSKPDKD